MTTVRTFESSNQSPSVLVNAQADAQKWFSFEAGTLLRIVALKSRPGNEQRKAGDQHRPPTTLESPSGNN
jgi:hypothetical protein